MIHPEIIVGLTVLMVLIAIAVIVSIVDRDDSESTHLKRDHSKQKVAIGRDR